MSTAKSTSSYNSNAYNCFMKRRPLTEQEKVIASRLKKIWLSKKKELGLTQDVAASRMGWKSQGTVGQYLNGSLALNTDAKLKFSELLNCDVTEIDPGFRSPVSEQPYIPLITLDQAGSWVPLNQPYPDDFTAKVIRPSVATLSDRSYVIDIKDDALGSFAPKGSQIAIDPEAEAETGKLAVFHLPDFKETYIGIYISRAGKESLKFLDGSDPIPLENAMFCGKAKVLMAKEL